jgi:2-polyprenyl-6-methoxyphenol hydroxylase-like FAD-dependent oxidoreductase
VRVTIVHYACRADHDLGLEKVSASNKLIVAMYSTGDPNRQSFTSEFEILRADLARIFVDLADRRPGVKFVYGDYVSALSHPAGESGPVHVEFTNGKLPAGDYDLVVGADGMMSRTRAIATGQPAKAQTVELGGTYCAYFTIPRIDSDSPTLARLYTATGARMIMLRPTPAGTGALFMFMRHGDAKIQAATAKGVDAQKAMLAGVFADAGWQTPRILEGMMGTDDFYFQEIAQVKSSRWSYGRTVLLGDAAYCPSPFTGMGTSLALYGTYILAGEISNALRDGRSLDDALARYDSMARPYVERVQKVPMSVVRLFFPKTRIGVWILDAVVALMYRIGVFTWGGYDSAEQEDEGLPVYDWTDEQ